MGCRLPIAPSFPVLQRRDDHALDVRDVCSWTSWRPDSLQHLYPRNQDPAFLAAVGARFAMISVGLGNDYGHPAAATIDLLTSAGVDVRRTDLDGAIAVVGPADRLHLETSGGG